MKPNPATLSYRALFIFIFLLPLLGGAAPRSVQAEGQPHIANGEWSPASKENGTMSLMNFDFNLDPVMGPIPRPLAISNEWNALGSGLNSDVWVIAVSGLDVYVGGDFTDAGGVANADYIAKFSGGTWSALDTGLNGPVRAIAIDGTDIYAGGNFTDAGGVAQADYIAKFSGGTWSALDTGLNDNVRSIAISGSDVYAGGYFNDAGGVAEADHIAKFSGGTWSALDTGLNDIVYSIVVNGSDIYAGGDFTNAGGITEGDYIAKFSSGTWSPLGMGLNSYVSSIAVSGSDVYVGGYFTDAGGVAEADHIAKFSGGTWSALGAGLNNFVYAVTISGSDVYAGGDFSDAGGVPEADHIAKFSGGTWSALGTTRLNSYVNTIANISGDVYAGGDFTDAGGNANADHIARFELPGASITVSTHIDIVDNDGECSLREAITAADTNTAIDTCTAGIGPDTILFGNSLFSNTITLASDLPVITDPYGLTLDGGGDVTISGDDQYRIFQVLAAPLIVENISLLDGYTLNGYGGALSNTEGLIVVRNSLFSNNTANGSGALYNSGGHTIIVNSTFTGNLSTGDAGGAIQNLTSGKPAILSIYNSTFSQNDSTTGGTVSNNGILHLYNTILANSSSGDDCANPGGTIAGTNNLIESDQCGFINGVNGNIIGSDPDLWTLTGSPSYLPFNIDSPAFDAGEDTICAADPVNNTSQNGVTRLQGAHCDIGAFEFTPTFADVPFGYWALQYVESLATAGITGGCGGGNYCPDNQVTRAQMAVFLLRGIHGSGYTPPAATGTVFNDVGAGDFAAAWIEQMVSEGITSGCGGGNYCPNATVTRAQMAVFLLRAKYGSGYIPPAATGTVFTDIPLGSFAAAWIEQLVSEGVTSGCGGGNYCPNAPVTRAQMAVFLVRIFNLP